jgi:hypothetical protein
MLPDGPPVWIVDKENVRQIITPAVRSNVSRKAHRRQCATQAVGTAAQPTDSSAKKTVPKRGLVLTFTGNQICPPSPVVNTTPLSPDAIRVGHQ